MTSEHFLMISIILFSTTIFILYIKKKVKIENLPPSPNKLPLIGNLHQLGEAPQRSLESLANKYGPLMLLKLGSVPTLVISSADIAREVFKNHDLAFSGRPSLYAAKKFSYNCSTMSFAPYGEYWREIRKILTLELLSAKRVQSFSDVRSQEVASVVEFIQNNSQDIVNLSELTMLLTNNIVRRVAFGEEGGGKEDGKRNFSEILSETQHLLGGFCSADFFPWMEWWNKFSGIEAKVEKNFKELDMYYEKVLKEHLERGVDEQDDLVDVLLRLQKDPNQAIKLTNDNIKAVLTDIFIAGTDTSAAALVWIMTELIKHPSIMKRVQDEIRSEFKNSTFILKESDLSKLSYMKMVIKEGLRLHPPAPLLLPRETTQTCIIEGYKIPTKTRVFVNAKSIATDPKYWDDPNKFYPERFASDSVDFRGQQFEFIPFGVGRRSCPGINFAISSIELALANLLYRFDWKLPNGMRVEDVDMEEDFGLTMHKKVPLCLVPSLAKI